MVDFTVFLIALFVTNIAWGCDGVKVSTKDGQTFGAQEVISTLPLGVLQRHHKDIFEPSLPQKHDEVLTADGIIMANLTDFRRL